MITLAKTCSSCCCWVCPNAVFLPLVLANIRYYTTRLNFEVIAWSSAHRIKLMSRPSYACLVSGPGLQSATVNYPTRFVVELSDSSGKPCSLEQNVTAELILQSTSSQAEPQSPDASVSAVVAMISPSQYEVSYTAVRRGPHKLHVQVNSNEIDGSPFTVIMYPDPTQIGSPVRIVKDLRSPYGITFNSCGEMIVTHWEGSEKVSSV